MRATLIWSAPFLLAVSGCATTGGQQASTITSSDIFEWRVAANGSGYNNPRQLPKGTVLKPFGETAFGVEIKQHEVTEPGKATDYDHAYGALMFQPLYLRDIVRPANCKVSVGDSAGSGFDDTEILRLVIRNLSITPTPHRVYWAVMRLAPHSHQDQAEPTAHSHLFITLPVDCNDPDKRQEMVTIVTGLELLPVLQSGRPDDIALRSLTHNGLIHGPKP